MWFFLSIYLWGLVAFTIHVYKTPVEQRTNARLLELFLLYQIVFSLGMTSLISFFGFTFMAPYVANYINWPQSPFEQEMGNVNLAFAVLGFLSIWYRGYFWMATIIGFAVWILGDAIHHVYEYYFHNNAAEGNIGVPLYTDTIVPIILLILLWMYMKNVNPKDQKEVKDLGNKNIFQD